MKSAYAFDCGLAVGVATIVALGSIHSYDNADSLVPIFVSLWHWTPFYWEQDRFGMLLPLLASPIKSPLINLLVQSWLTVFSGVMALLLTARWLWPDRGVGAPLGLISLVTFLIFTPVEFQAFFWSTGQPYAVALFLMVVAALVVEAHSGQMRIRVLVAPGLLVFVAAWVNPSICLLFVPVATAVWCAHRRQRSANLAVLAAAGVAASLGWQRFATFRTTWIVWPSLEMWPILFATFWRDVLVQLGLVPWAIAVVAIAAVGLLRSFRHGGLNERFRDLRLSGLLVLASVAYSLVPALLLNGRPRYFTAAFVLLHVALVSWIARGFWNATKPSSLALRNALAILALSLCLFLYGWPSPAGVERHFMSAWGGSTDAIVEHQATHVIGDYWSVWPTVFAAHLELRRRDIDRPVWALTFRARETSELWGLEPMDQWVLISLPGDPEVKRYASLYGLGTLTVVRETTAAWTYQTAR